MSPKKRRAPATPGRTTGHRNHPAGAHSRIADLELQLKKYRALTVHLLALARAAQLDGGVQALRDAVKDYVPDTHGDWPTFLTNRADRLQERRNELHVSAAESLAASGAQSRHHEPSS